MADPRTICVFTGTRADYGLLYPLMREIERSPALHLQLLVTGTHLSPEFGLTKREIERDGFTIDAEVEMILSSDTPNAIAAAMGLGTIRYADALEHLDPDIMVVLGDRYEGLAVAQAALVRRLPIAHIHGGETTEGAFDEAIRHSITKMSHLHFASAAAHRLRIVQLGEAPDRVFDVGAPGVDNLQLLPLLDIPALEEALQFELGDANFLVTYHPATLSEQDPAAEFGALLEALDAYPEAKIVITKANADTQGRIINEMAENYAARNAGRVLAKDSLGQIRYLSLLCAASVVVGNSSSGLIEAPAAGTPTVNIGDRQKGRLRGPSVIDCAGDRDAIRTAVGTALGAEMQRTAAERVSPYGDGGAASKMVELLAQYPLDRIVEKRFRDLPANALMLPDGPEPDAGGRIAGERPKRKPA